MEFDDEDLASLEDQKKKPEIITIDDSDDEQPADDEEAAFQAQIRKAIEESKAESSKSSVQDTSKPPPSQVPQAASSSTGVPSFLAQRAQLEKERLERQKKLQSQSQRVMSKKPESVADSDAESTEDEDERPSKRRHIASSSFTGTLSQEAGGSKVSQPEDQIFWNGELRQTATQFAEPRADGQPTFRLTQILGQKSEMEFAIISSYSLDLPWVYQFFDPSVPVILVAQPDANGQATTLQRMLHSINVVPALRTIINDNHPNLPIKLVDELRQKWDWSKVKVHLVASIAGKHESWPSVINAQDGHEDREGSKDENPNARMSGVKLGRKQWGTKNFPRDNFYDSKSKAGPALMHSKMIIATLQSNAYTEKKSRNQEPSDSEDEVDDDIQEVEPGIGWIYVGSHNFTPSAWGTLSGSSFNPTLNINNYEVGVVFPIKDEAEAAKLACFQRPPRKYATGKDEPWIQEESVYHQDE
ncbi:hypothetical protein H1R20_g5159, partial [Candolleomyces eurysporus]